LIAIAAVTTGIVYYLMSTMNLREAATPLSSKNSTGNNTTAVKPEELQAKITAVNVKVDEQPAQVSVHLADGNRTMIIAYLPVTISRTIDLSGVNNSNSATTIERGSFLRLYPTQLSSTGQTLVQHKYSILDKNGKPLEFRGYRPDTHPLTNATCNEPFPSRVINGGGIIVENTTKPVPSYFTYDDDMNVTFEKQQLLPNSKIYYVDEEWGIEKMNNSGEIPNGAGNKEIAGKYNLGFISFHNTTI